jgi:hypothetical protein
LSEHQPRPLDPGELRLDGEDATYRLLGFGAGVTDYDEEDCLRLLVPMVG